jgi:hypothetical protein
MSKYFFVLVYLFSLLGTFVSGKKGGGHALTKQDRKWKARKIFCEESVCFMLPVDENQNCVNKCVSEKCFEEVYGAVGQCFIFILFFPFLFN